MTKEERRQIEFTQRQIEVTQRQIEVTQRQIEVTQSQIEVTQRQIEVTQRRACGLSKESPGDFGSPGQTNDRLTFSLHHRSPTPSPNSRSGNCNLMFQTCDEREGRFSRAGISKRSAANKKDSMSSMYRNSYILKTQNCH